MPRKPEKPDFEDYPTEQWRDRYTHLLGWCPQCADTGTILDSNLNAIPCPTCALKTVKGLPKATDEELEELRKQGLL